MTDPITLFLEDIKEKDKDVVLEAMNKLTVVAAAIGPKRTVKELLPLLPQLSSIAIDEVLSSLARQLYNVFDIAGAASIPADTLQLILDTLKNLCGEEEVVIRDDAVSSLSKILESISSADVSSRGLPIYRALVGGDWFAPRVSAASLTPALVAMLRDADLAEVLSLYVALASDETPMTRRAAARALSAVAAKLAEHAGHSLAQVSQRFKPEVYPLLQALAVDARDHLRELAPQALAAITPLIPAADFFHLVLPLVTGLRDDHSWRVRAALATALPSLAHGLLALAQTHVQQKAANPLYQGGHFELGGLVRALFDAHVALLRDGAEEVRAMAVLGLANMLRAAYGVPLLVPARPRFTVDVTAQDSFDFSSTHLVPAAPKQHPPPMAGFLFPGAAVFDRLADALALLARDQSSILKQDLCDQVGAVALLVGRDLTSAHLVPVLHTLMHDQSADVLASVAENLEAPAEALGAPALATSILPILTTLLKDTRWRIHRAVAANLGMLARLLSKGKVFEARVVPMVKSLLTQHCHAVRNRACVEMRVITYELGIEVVLEKLFPAAAELYDAKINYLHRLTALHFCLFTATAQQRACPAQVIVDHFCPIFIQGLRDPVPNVRILAAQSVAAVIPRLDRAYIQAQLLPLLENVACDADKEVALQASLALDAAQR